MTVKRWSVGVDGPDENGNLVAYADYLSLAAENSSLRLTIDKLTVDNKLMRNAIDQTIVWSESTGGCDEDIRMLHDVVETLRVEVRHHDR